MTEPAKTFLIRFEDVSVAEANIKARNLRYAILEAVPEMQVSVLKENEGTQDFGTTLVLVLGTQAVIELCKGIAGYLSRDRGRITIEANGKVVAEGLSGNDAARIAEAFNKKS